jgi:hypothetical protein
MQPHAREVAKSCYWFSPQMWNILPSVASSAARQTFICVSWDETASSFRVQEVWLEVLSQNFSAGNRRIIMRTNTGTLSFYGTPVITVPLASISSHTVHFGVSYGPYSNQSLFHTTALTARSVPCTMPRVYCAVRNNFCRQFKLCRFDTKCHLSGRNGWICSCLSDRHKQRNSLL